MAHYLIVDLEGTCCDQGSVPAGEMEIIEIGAVIVDEQDFIIQSQFQAFIKPILHTKLSPFCQQLTQIRQQDVDNALGFAAVLQQFTSWIEQQPTAQFASWGNFDAKQLQQDAQLHQLILPKTLLTHCNLKKCFSKAQRLRSQVGLAFALKLAGLAFIGTHHRALSDAQNIARLLPYCLGQQPLTIASR